MALSTILNRNSILTDPSSTTLPADYTSSVTHHIHMPETITVKRFHDLQCDITCIELFNDHVIIGTSQSQINLFDQNLHFIKQYSSLNIGAIINISISANHQNEEERLTKKIWTDQFAKKSELLQLDEVVCRSDQVSSGDNLHVNTFVFLFIGNRRCTAKLFSRYLPVGHEARNEMRIFLVKIAQTFPLGQITDTCLNPRLPVLYIGTSVGHLYACHGEGIEA